MSITPWTIYWITRLDPINDLALAAVLLGSLALGIAVALAVREMDASPKWAALPLLWVLFWGAITVFLPSTKEAVAMIVVPKILANEKVQQLPENFLTLANEWMEELRPAKKASK